jgi:cyclic pyranopterin phosphate synthase
MPEQEYVWLPREDLLHFEEIERLVDVFIGLGVDKVRLTGGEPLLRARPVTLVAKLAARPRIRDLAMTTNGDLARAACARRCAPPACTADRQPRHVASDRFTGAGTRRRTHRVLEGIAAAAPLFPGLKIDTVAIRGSTTTSWWI